MCPSQDKAQARAASLFSTVQLTAPDGVSVMSQTLWPRHCVANTWGSECPPELRSGPSDVIVYKGTHPGIDSYSAFYDNAKFKQTTMLKELRSRGVTHVFLCGVALDVCVAFSALHAAEEGFVTAVVEDACRGVSLEGIAEKKNLMLEAGVLVLDAADVRMAPCSDQGAHSRAHSTSSAPACDLPVFIVDRYPPSSSPQTIGGVMCLPRRGAHASQSSSPTTPVLSKQGTWASAACLHVWHLSGRRGSRQRPWPGELRWLPQRRRQHPFRKRGRLRLGRSRVLQAGCTIMQPG